MTTPSVDELCAAWTSRAASTRDEQADVRLRAALQLLADGRPVAAADIAAATGEAVVEVQTWLTRMRFAGYELDEQSRLVGAALSLRPTGHRFRVRGNDLYAWCGFDTLFLPILLDETAVVASTCPVTGDPVHLTVAPNGAIIRAEPATAMVAIVGPAVLDACETTGPRSPVCAQMPLLADLDAGQRWLEHRPGVAVIDLDTATTLARAYTGQNGCRH